MFSELLDKNKYSSIDDVESVLDNLCADTKEELKLLFGADYQEKTFEKIKDSEIFVIRLKSNREPVGLFGLIDTERKEAKGIYLLTTDKLHSGNIITFLKGARKQVKKWQNEYGLIMDNLHKENNTIKKWLKLLGFQPSPYQNEEFQIYYIGDLSFYE